MEKTLFFAMILLVSVLVSTVHGRGEVILDRIVPVNSDRVTFLDPLFTNLGVLNHIVTDTFAVTRQFELNVGVPDVFLTGLGGGAVFSGSLGGLISSKNGDISLSANRTVQFLSGGINALAFGNVTFLSGEGDINFNSSYPFVVNAGSASLFSESGLNATTLGHITFTAGDYLALTSGGALNIVTDGEFSLDARHGNVVFTIGNTVDLSTTEYARIDGVHGLSIAARTDLSLIGGASVLVQSVTHDTIVRDDINFQFRNLQFYGSTGLVFGAGNVNVLAATSMGLTGQSQTSEHGFEFGEALNITARGSANFNTAGASSAIEFENTGLFANITDTVSLRAGYNVVFGSNSTDNFSILSKNLFVGASHSHIRADNNVTIGAFGEASFATATTILTADRISSISESVQGITADDLLVLTRAKQAEPSSIDSNRDLVFTAGSDFTFYGFKVLAQYNGTQTYTVSELNINSGPNGEIGISAVDNLSVTTTNDITGITRDLNYFIGGDLTFTLNDAVFQADETLARNFNSSFTSSGATQISGGRLLINGGNTTVTSDASSINIGADNYHVNGDEIMFNGNQVAVTVDLIHIDADSHTEWNINNLDLTANNNIYIKTSILSLANNNTFDVVASSVTGIINQLNFNSTGDIDLDTSGRGDIVFSSGSGSITLFSNNSQVYNIGTDFQLKAQEEIGFTGGAVVGFAAANDITMKGSQEFEFYANNSIEFTSNDSTYEADIFVARTEGNLISTTAEADLFESGWFVVEGDDVIIRSNTFLFEPSSANALDLQLDSSNVAFGGSKVTYSSGDITFNAVDYQLAATTNLNFNIAGESVIGSEAYIITSKGTVNFQPLVTSAITEIYSGVDDFIVFEAATTQTFSAIDLLSITGYQSVVDFTATTAIVLQSVATTTFTSVDETVISSADTLNIVAESSLTLSSFEDLSFETFNNSNIVINVAQSYVTNVGRDFYIIADGLDTDVSTNCSISITSNFGDTLFNSQAGKLNLDSRDDFQIRSFLSTQANSGAFNVNAFGNIYMESLQRALTYISDDAVTFSTTDTTNNGNMEWIAADAAGLFLAENGFQLSSDDFHIEGEDGVSFIANQTSSDTDPNGISWTGLNSFVSGTRGIRLFAGTDAPVVAADVTFKADNLFLEAQDRIYQRTIGKLTLEAGEFTLNTFEGNAITIIAAGDYTHTAVNYIVRTEDGNILVNSNSKSLRSTSTSETIFQTLDGPIGFDAISGSFSFVAPDITVTSVKDMDLTTLGKALITAGNNLDVVGTDEGCVIFETRRTLDTITMNAAITTIIVDSTDVNNEEPDIQVYGNNIDFTNPSITGFTAQDDIIIGDDSAPIVRITATNTPQNPGVTITSSTSLYVNTSNTFTSTSDTFTFDATEESSFVALGSITAVSQTGDVVFTANEGDVTTVAETITTTIGGIDTLTGGDSVVLSSTGVDLGDRFEFTSSGNVIVNAIDARLGTQNRDSSYEADIAGDFTLTFGTVLISNSENYGLPTTDYPYADYNTERSEIIISNINQPATYTATTSVTYTVGTDDGSDIPLYNRPTFYQTTDGDFTISTVGFNLFSSDEVGAILPNVYLGTQGTFTSTSNNEFLSISLLDTVVDSLQNTVVTATTSATFTSGVYSVYRVDGAATETIDGDFTLTAGTGTLTDYSPYVQYKSEIGSIDVTAPNGITFTARGTTPASTQSEQYFRVHAGRDLNFAATDTTFTVSGSEVEFTGGDVEISAATSTTINAAQSTYESQGLASDIIFTGTGAFTYTGGDFVNLVGSDNVIANANSQIITAPVVSYNSLSGNVADISDDLTIAATTSATFTSKGYLSNNNGIYIHTTLAADANGFTLSAPTTATFTADEQQRYLSLETTTLTAPTLYVETTGTNSPILIDSRLGALSVVSTTGAIEGGNRAGFYADDSQTIIVGGTFIASTAFRANGILFDTDYNKNFHSSASVTATTIGVTAPELILFDIQRERAGPVQLIRDDAFNIGITSSLLAPQFVAENSDIILASTTSVTFNGQKDIRIKASDVNINAATSNVFNAPLGDITIQSKAGNVIYSDENIYTVLATNEISMYTNGFGFQNDISFVTGGFPQTWAATTAMRFAGANGNAGVLIEGSQAGSSVNLLAGDDLNTVSLAGQQYIYYDDDVTNAAARGIFINAATTMNIATSEARGSIFFQSDDETVFQSNSIRHTQYMARLGFFSTAPDHIHSVNANAVETCVRVGYCGDLAGGEFTGALSNLNAKVSFLTTTLRELGLIDYKYSYN